MAKQIIDIGTQGNDGTGDSIRESFRKVNDNFTQIFAIFGAGDRISFRDLDDTPVNFPNGIPRGDTNSDADKIIVSNEDADALVAKKLVGGEGISIDHSNENEIVIKSVGEFNNLVISGLVKYSVQDGITSTGTSQSTAFELTKNINIVTTSSSGNPASGVSLPSTIPVVGNRIIVRNDTNNNVTVYPNSGYRIGTLGNNVGFVLNEGTTLEFVCVRVPANGNPGQWYTL
jgi:hypothetical protein